MIKRCFKTFKTVEVIFKGIERFKSRYILDERTNKQDVNVLEHSNDSVYVKVGHYPFSLLYSPGIDIIVVLYKDGGVYRMPQYNSKNAVEDFLNSKHSKKSYVFSHHDFYWSVCTFKATVTFLCCMKKLSKLPKDVYKIIAKKIYNSNKDLRWFL